MYLWLWRSLLARHRSRERESKLRERESKLREDEEESKLGRGNWKSEAQQRLEQEGWEMRWDDVLSLYFSVLASCMWCRSSTCCNQEKRDEEMEEETLMSENVKWKKKKREIRQYVWCFALLALSGIQAYFIQREREMRERERLWCVREQHEHASTVIFFCFKLQKNDSLFSSLSFLLSGWTESHTGIERERDKQITKIITKKNGVWHLT